MNNQNIISNKFNLFWTTSFSYKLAPIDFAGQAELPVWRLFGGGENVHPAGSQERCPQSSHCLGLPPTHRQVLPERGETGSGK